VTFVTANADPHRINAPIDWRTFGTTQGTLVIFMGARTLPLIVPFLLEGGMPADRPAAAIQWGTYKDKQRTLVGTVGTLVELMEREGMTAPVSVVIGEVVRLRDQIAWFEHASSGVA
jgi:siroheme synthase